MLLLAYRGNKKPYAWTALCKAPAVRAISFWPQESVAWGGGFFDERLPIVWVNHIAGFVNPEISENLKIEFGYLENREKQFFGSQAERLARSKWKPEKPLRIPPNMENGHSLEMQRWFKKSPNQRHTLEICWQGTEAELMNEAANFQYPRLVYRVSLTRKREESWDLEGVEWADWNRQGLLTIAMGGCLYLAKPEAPPSQWALVADFTGLTPRQRLPRFNNLRQPALTP